MRPWSNFPPNIHSRWLVWITHIAWTWPLLYPQHIINIQNGVKKKPRLDLELLAGEEKNNKDFLSHHAHRSFLRQRCVKWSVKWVHLTSLRWIILYTLCYAGVREHLPSRLGVCPPLAPPATQVDSLFTECQHWVKELEKSYLWNRLRGCYTRNGSEQTYPKLTFKPIKISLFRCCFWRNEVTSCSFCIFVYK